MALSRISLSLGALILGAGSVLSVPQQAAAGPDDSLWYQAPSRAARPAQASRVQPRQESHRSRVRVLAGSRYGSSYCSPYDRFSTRYYSSSRYGYSSLYPRYSSYSYSRPTIISYPSSSNRITYVTPVVQETQYDSRSASGAYDAVSYREYQRLLAEQRVLRQQIIEMEREQADAAAPTYNPGPPVPSRSPLNIAKQSADSPVKPDRVKSETEVLPPVPNEASIRAETETERAGAAGMPAAWGELAGADFTAAMVRFTELAGEEGASTADRVGFALSAAGIGQHEPAAWAMRRVLVADPEGFGFIPASDELRETLKRLSGTIASDAEVLPDAPERRMLMFLVASIDYLVLDMKSGLERLDEARVDGADHHEGAVQLRRLLEESGTGGF